MRKRGRGKKAKGKSKDDDNEEFAYAVVDVRSAFKASGGGKQIRFLDSVIHTESRSQTAVSSKPPKSET